MAWYNGIHDFRRGQAIETKPRANFIPPELYAYLQFTANQIEEAARGLDLIKGNDRITARTIAYEILRSIIPDSCMHVDFRKYNSQLWTCKGCFGLFRNKDDLAPIQLLDLVPEFKRKQEYQQTRHRIWELCQALHQKIRSHRVAMLDEDYRRTIAQKNIIKPY